MADHPRTAVVDFVAKLIKSKPELTYVDVVKEGRAKGFNVYPLIMGLAKKQLGMSAPRRGHPRTAAVGLRVSAGKVKRAPRRTGSPSLVGDLTQAVGKLAAEADGMRSTLKQIAQLAGSI